MIKVPISLVTKFHDAFGLDKNKKPTVDLSKDIIKLRHRLMKEETSEYYEAASKGDLVETVDALGDMLYILCGTIITHGCQELIEDVFKEIHRSNMSKLDSKGHPIYRKDGKVIKSENFSPPKLAEIVNQHLS
ncbi:MAG: nucleoside triphosphate pyrophosphohydrolase family protein [Flavobacteriaceae bacterium]|nr:nucleoside triphosphate pyrophosphohydrolase family protein [Flavobacteriaceae bacterium]